jgi:hypothetical protein
MSIRYFLSKGQPKTINTFMSDYTEAREPLKKTRQDLKLAKAEADRAARNVVEPGRYPDVTADATQIMRYGAADNDPANYVAASTPLKKGRPWAT